MAFGNIFRYNCMFYDGEVRVWRVLAESREEADIKLNDYICVCGSSGMQVPVSVEFSSEEDNLILY